MTGSVQVKGNKLYCVLNFKDNKGRRKPKWFATGLEAKGNKKRAESMLRDLLAKYEHTSAESLQKIMFTDYIHQWLELKKPQIDIVTYEGYETTCNAHILPYFKDMKLDIRDVTAKHIQEYYNEKFLNGKIRRYDKAKNTDAPIGLAVSSLRKHRIVLNQVFEDAIFNRITDYNPVTFAKLPKSQKSAPIQFYNNTQANKLLGLITDYTYKTLISVVLYYGLRRSEVLGLRVSAIDFDKNEFTINHTVVCNKSIVYKDSTKSDTSNTTFPLLPKIKEMFLELIHKKQENKDIFGTGYKDTDYIFVWEDGTPYSPDYVSKKFEKIIKKSDLPRITFHKLRHSTASILLEKGWDIKSIQLWLRHADVKTTLNIYAHIKEDQKVAMAKSIDNTFLI
ncbi:MAG: site-specific integrase [Ruminococcaceae bacterium]|nr:site-specific integrase [Oscillospiraceae bacterium]